MHGQKNKKISTITVNTNTFSIIPSHCCTNLNLSWPRGILKSHSSELIMVEIIFTTFSPSSVSLNRTVHKIQPSVMSSSDVMDKEGSMRLSVKLTTLHPSFRAHRYKSYQSQNDRYMD